MDSKDLYKKALEFYNDEHELSQSIEHLINELKEVKYNFHKKIGLTRTIPQEEPQGTEEQLNNYYKEFFDNVYSANALTATAFYSLINQTKTIQNKLLDMRIHYLQYSLNKNYKQ